MAYKFQESLVLIASTTASASASVAFTSKITTNFTVYVVKLRVIVAATLGKNLILTFSTDNGSTYLSTNYQWGNIEGKSTAGVSNLGSTSDTSIQIGGANDQSPHGYNADITLYNLNDSTFSPRIDYTTVLLNNSTRQDINQGAGFNSTTTPVTAIKIAFNSGNITSGTFSLYGVNI